VLAEDADLALLLLLPALVVLLPLGGSLLRLRWHPAVSPRLPWERRPWRAASRSNPPRHPAPPPSRSPHPSPRRALRGRPTQARTELVGLDLDHRALVAFLGLPGAHLQPAGHDDARAPGEGLGAVLGQAPPGVDREVRRLAVLPVARLVLVAAVDRHAELHDGGPVGRVAELGIVREVAHDGDLVLARHLHHLPFRDRSPSDGIPGRGKCSSLR